MSRRHLLLTATVAASALLLPVGALASGHAPTITETASSAFPDRAYVISLPARAILNEGNVVVRENGEPVTDLKVRVPGQESATSYGIVLVLDASNSMRGDPIAQAMDAARAFASKRTALQQVGVVVFNDVTRVLLPLTADPDEIREALAETPPLANRTRLFDAILRADEMLRSANITIGTIVVLSDGNDIGSEASRAEVLEQLKASRTRLFSVGLRSSQFNEAPLRILASGTGGDYTVASTPSDLNRIFVALGTAIANEYSLTYRSHAPTAQRVVVSVQIAGFDDVVTSAYVSPGKQDLGRTSWWDRLIQSPWLAAIISLAVVGLIGSAVYLVARRSDRRFQRLLAPFVTTGPLGERAVRPDVPAELMSERIARSLAESMSVSRALEDAELAGMRLTRSSLLTYVTAAAIVLAAIVAAATGSLWGLAAGLVAPVVARSLITRKLKSVRNEFAEQLPDNLDVLSSALRAGHSMMGALSVAVEASGEPSRQELGRALADEQLGMPLDDALRLVGARMDNRDIVQVALVAGLQRDAGANAAEVLDHVATNIRHQMELRRLIRTLTAQGRMARWIVSLLPVFLFVALYLLNRDYLRPLWETDLGKVAMGLAIAMIVAGSLVIKRIIEIKV
jgi:tight adherence protein B